MPKSVVVAVDDSDSARAALDWTLENMVTVGDVVYLVHCFNPLQASAGPFYGYVPTGWGEDGGGRGGCFC